MHRDWGAGGTGNDADDEDDDDDEDESEVEEVAGEYPAATAAAPGPSGGQGGREGGAAEPCLSAVYGRLQEAWADMDDGCDDADQAVSTAVKTKAPWR